jgi:hypothetical protein
MEERERWYSFVLSLNKNKKELPLIRVAGRNPF